ncbi:MAG: hypothetical protein Q7S24_00080 [bacterium]|nr:hypothetical protein [bacterium]
MSDRKNFFESLEPKSALVVGLVGGVLVLCTIGFFVMLGISLSKTSTFGIGNKANTTATADPTQNDVAPAPTPVVTKSDRPKVELFVMSYCPYGLQMEKAYLPVMELLKNKADLSIKYVSYAMHGKKEIDENTRQVCINKQYPDKFLPYMKCFVGEDNYQKCLGVAGVNEANLTSCMGATDKQFAITANFNDQSKWLSGRYPIYAVNADLNEKYGVQGSPTLVINGAEANADRTPEGVKRTVCAAFNNAPEECKTVLGTGSFGAGFGLSAGANTGGAECAT